MRRKTRSNSISSLDFRHGEMLQEQLVESLSSPVLVVGDQLEEAGKIWPDGSERQEWLLLTQREQRSLAYRPWAPRHHDEWPALQMFQAFICHCTEEQMNLFHWAGKLFICHPCDTIKKIGGGEKWSMQQFRMNMHIKLYPAVFLFFNTWLCSHWNNMHNKQHTN